jgi:hypothetical protein
MLANRARLIAQQEQVFAFLYLTWKVARRHMSSESTFGSVQDSVLQERMPDMTSVSVPRLGT